MCVCAHVEVGPALHQCQLIVTEMLHFVQQVQYYINFEVTLMHVVLSLKVIRAFFGL